MTWLRIALLLAAIVFFVAVITPGRPWYVGWGLGLALFAVAFRTATGT